MRSRLAAQKLAFGLFWQNCPKSNASAYAPLRFDVRLLFSIPRGSDDSLHREHDARVRITRY
jgi:hypothetical protein